MEGLIQEQPADMEHSQRGQDPEFDEVDDRICGELGKISF